MKDKRLGGAGVEASRSVKEILRKEGTVVRIETGTLIYSSKKGYLELGNMPCTELSPCWHRATWEGWLRISAQA